jgi:hypothetical protein
MKLAFEGSKLYAAADVVALQRDDDFAQPAIVAYYSSSPLDAVDALTNIARRLGNKQVVDHNIVPIAPLRKAHATNMNTLLAPWCPLIDCLTPKSSLR